MRKTNLWFKSFGALGFSLVLLASPASNAQENRPAQNNPPSSINNLPSKRQTDLERRRAAAENRGKYWPTRRASGGKRPVDSCFTYVAKQKHEAIALVPDTLLLTASNTPNLFISLPPLKAHCQVEFVLRDSQDKLVYEKTFTVSSTEDFIALTIPKNTEKFAGLQAGEEYHWYISVIYDPQERAKDDVLEGWISYQPLEADYARQIKTATPLEQVAIYQETERWSEAAQTLLDLRQSQPQNPQVEAAWQDMVKALQLDTYLSAQN
jgi:hypothetical protein